MPIELVPIELVPTNNLLQSMIVWPVELLK